MNKKAGIEYIGYVVLISLCIATLVFLGIGLRYSFSSDFGWNYGSGVQIGYITNIEDGIFKDNLYFRASLYGVEEEEMHIQSDLLIYRSQINPEKKYKIYYNRYFFGGDCVYRLEMIE
jgi:membrane protein YdbS with pleckstrin-like domain